jgi:heme exporter protein D|tara:strand:- start:479 stop:625 length:147 start_codon:yes stop_codon:yes gene_type:complete
MALDAVQACTKAFEASGANGFFVWLTVFFSLFIFADTVIAAATLRSKL